MMLKKQGCGMGHNLINVKERMDYYQVKGLSLALIENGQISRLDQYGLLEVGTDNAVQAESIFNACSISKFLTGMLVMVLAERGVLHLDEDINHRLQSWKVPDNRVTVEKKVTLRQLLSHQSGVVDPAGSFMELGFRNEASSMAELLEGKTAYCSVPIEAAYVPGSEFHYSDAGYCIVQLLIEDVTGRSFEELAYELIFEPLKMENSSFPRMISGKNYACGHDKNGQLIEEKYSVYPYPAASGLWTAPAELAGLVIELMNAINGESKIGLSAEKAKEIIQQQGKDWAGLGVFLDGSDKELEISSLGWGVGFQCMMAAYPYKGAGLVIMMNTDSGVHQMKGIIGEIYRSLF
ncbi:penicillin-binding protein [Bacillus sp. UMB0728]|uniref:serine hydrolase domain-containing protein n=2 Tax=Bacillaceae TaxID=186817 RepID=UPI000C771640|nr:penicillin-binding protein [Bacillus sp. UMB0728]